VRHHIEAHVTDVSSPAHDRARAAPGPIIDAEYEQIEDPDRSERRDHEMPPPRGDWGRGP
jgi:hypothetical protein